MKKLERPQILSQFKKVMIKLYKYLYGVAANEIDSALPRLKEVSHVVNLEFISLSGIIVPNPYHVHFFHRISVFLMSLFLFCFQRVLGPHSITVDEDLNEAAQKVEVWSM